MIELNILKYIDSIDNAKNDEELPQFLKDSQFDYHNRGLWTTLHTPVSVRSRIINRVNNCHSLMLIIESKQNDINAKPIMEDSLKVPFMEYSFYDLALKRKEILECK